MRRRLLHAGLLGMLIPLAGYAGDAAKPRREIIKQPVYTSGAPRYALLVFGEKADRSMWVVIDGNTIYIDRNGNGDLTDPEDADRSSLPRTSFRIKIQEAKGHPQSPSEFIYIDRSSPGFRIRRTGGTSSMRFVGFGKSPRVEFGKTPATAPVLHFDGPLSIGRYGDVVTVPRKPNESVRTTWLRVTISTPIAGTNATIDLHFRCSSGFGPLIGEFEYRDAAGKPIRVKHELKQSG